MLLSVCFYFLFVLFFCNDSATTELHTLSLHDALPILRDRPHGHVTAVAPACNAHAVVVDRQRLHDHVDRKSTRLNSSHLGISYAVFCLKKKKESIHIQKSTRRTI